MGKKITKKELDRMISEEVNSVIKADDAMQFPKGRDLTIELKSLKTRLPFIDFKSLPQESALLSNEFKQLSTHLDKYNELFAKIKSMVVSKIVKLAERSFNLECNGFQLSDDDKKVFLIFGGDTENLPDSFGDILDGAAQEINEAIQRFAMRVTIQLVFDKILVTLTTPFDFSSYNREIDKHIR